MTALKEAKMLCWNCDGNVSITLTNCPYCGVDLEPTEEAVEPHTFREPTRTSPLPSARSDHPFKTSLLPLLLLIPGGIFFVFSLTLALFSRQGVLILRWDASYWYLYLLAALPMLVFGWNLASGSPEEG